MIATEANAAELWAGLMDETVAEVFGTMLGVRCAAIPAPGDTCVEIVACVAFFGAISGQCVVAFSTASAAMLGEIFLGGAVSATMIADAVGELCNMLAGGWKRRLGMPASGAGLSVPILERRTDHGPHDVCRCYEFDECRFAVQMHIRAIGE